MYKKRILSALLVIVLLATMIIVAEKNSVWKYARENTESEEAQSETQKETQPESQKQEQAAQSEVQPEAQKDAATALYAKISPCLVHIVVKQSAGTGIIWEIGQDRIVIASNRHVFTGDVEAEITFVNGDKLTAQALGYSAQYDVAFFEIEMEDISPQLLQAITEARRPLEIAWEERTGSGTSVMQAATNGEYYQGTVNRVEYIPEFGTDMLCTSCYAKAGMSGGGVFDEEGWLLGMITGGEAADSGNKETWLTYSIPVTVIEQEYVECYSQNVRK